MIKDLYDNHVHTINSHDGHVTADDLCQKALDIGLHGVAFTDHAECQGYQGNDYEANIARSVAASREMQQKYAGKLDVICGLEMGQPLQDPDLAQRILDHNSFDFILGSLHGLGGKAKEDFVYWHLVDPKTDLDGKMEEYLHQLMDLVRWGQFDVLAHITYCARCIVGIHHMECDMDRYSDLVDELLRMVIDSGKGIEINTSTLRSGLDFTMPDLKMVKRYRELGGEIITVGSDAHYAEHLGADLDTAIEILQQAGFRYTAHYHDRKPEFLPV